MFTYTHIYIYIYMYMYDKTYIFHIRNMHVSSNDVCGAHKTRHPTQPIHISKKIRCIHMKLIIFHIKHTISQLSYFTNANTPFLCVDVGSTCFSCISGFNPQKSVNKIGFLIFAYSGFRLFGPGFAYSGLDSLIQAWIRLFRP